MIMPSWCLEFEEEKIIESLELCLNPLKISQPTCHDYPEDEMVPHDVLLVPTQPSGHVEIPGQFHFKFPSSKGFSELLYFSLLTLK